MNVLFLCLFFLYGFGNIFSDMLKFILFSFLSLIKFYWMSYMFYLMILVSFLFLLLLSSLPYGFVYGVSLLWVFGISWCSWFMTLFVSGISISFTLTHLTLVNVLLLSFNYFIIFLRPFTLTLRIFINLSLGHAVFIILSGKLTFFIILFFMVEFFVYIVQSFVFFSLMKSYLPSKDLEFEYSMARLQWEGMQILA